MSKPYRRVAERIEAAIPARLLWWSCNLMAEDDRDGDRDVCLSLGALFDAVVQDQFRDLCGIEKQKAWARLGRMMKAVQGPLHGDDKHVGLALVVCRVIVQRVWNAGCYEPDELFLAAWNTLSDGVYNTCDNGRCLNAVDAEAAVIANAIVDRLHREYGLWRDLSRNERAATPYPLAAEAA